MEGKIGSLWNEVRELSLGNSGQLDRLDFPPTPLQFLRDFVSQNKPCIISNATNHWPALSRWTRDSYLTDALSSAHVSLHLTPHGRADALVPSSSSSPLCFASAHVQRTPFPEALRLITTKHGESSPPNLVAYAQQQNNCFPSEYSALAADCDPHIDFATEALGCLPEAVNMWIDPIPINRKMVSPVGKFTATEENHIRLITLIEGGAPYMARNSCCRQETTLKS